MSVGLLEEGFRTSLPLRVRYDGGGYAPLAVHRWQGRARGADKALLERARGLTLDIGCGPGRLVSALTRAGIPALGIDIAPAAVRLTRRAGAAAVRTSVFGDVPAAGRWDCAVLADGNIGIGGEPVRLLRRVRELLAPGGRVLVELEAPGTGTRAHRVRLEDHAGRVGSWFPWAVVGIDALSLVAGAAGLTVRETWSAADADARAASTGPARAAAGAEGEPVYDGDEGVRWFAALHAA